MEIKFKKKAYAVSFVKKETKEIVNDSVFLSQDRAMRYAADCNELEQATGQGDLWFFIPIDFDDEK